MKGLLIFSFNSCETLAGLMVPANLDTHKSMAAVMEGLGKIFWLNKLYAYFAANSRGILTASVSKRALSSDFGTNISRLRVSL